MIFGLTGWALSLVWTADALRMRARAKALAVLAPSDAPVSRDHVFLVRPGVTLDEATKRAASAHARARGLDVLDIVPSRLDAWRTTVLLLTTDPAKYKDDRVTQGITAGDALLVDARLLARAREASKKDLEPGSALELLAAARILKRYAATSFDLAVAPGLESPPLALPERRRLLRMLFSDLVGPFLALQHGLLGGAVALSPVAGLTALAVHALGALAATAGTPLTPKDRLAYAALRVPIDLASAFGPVAPPPTPRIAPESLRPTYDELLAGGTARFFEPPREDCPICAGRALTKVFDVNDRHQHKPGRFTLVRCDGCGHVFQNPRLSIAGLEFYYRDFYDGLGEEGLESMFASSPHLYRARAKMVAEVGKPRRWLDVGAGHGHFCNVARELLPDTTFDGLDLNEAIVDAERRGWVARGIRGLFPEVAPELAASGQRYDVVSMSHYLEHTTDPRAEIEAASKVLAKDGLFFIELPDPESRFGRLLGKRWMPWFQPQHLHLLDVKNLERLLREHGFSPLAWHRGEAHQPCDLVFLAFNTIEALAPTPDRPWMPPRKGAHARRRAAMALGVPLLAGAWALDHAVAPLARRPGWANAYRVVARKTA